MAGIRNTTTPRLCLNEQVLDSTNAKAGSLFVEPRVSTLKCHLFIPSKYFLSSKFLFLYIDPLEDTGM